MKNNQNVKALLPKLQIEVETVNKTSKNQQPKTK